jgi:hypothetical protein
VRSLKFTLAMMLLGCGAGTATDPSPTTESEDPAPAIVVPDASVQLGDDAGASVDAAPGAVDAYAGDAMGCTAKTLELCPSFGDACAIQAYPSNAGYCDYLAENRHIDAAVRWMEVSCGNSEFIGPTNCQGEIVVVSDAGISSCCQW